MLEIQGIWHCHMSRWDRYVLHPRIWMETSRSGTVPHIGPYTFAAQTPSHHLAHLCIDHRRTQLDHLIPEQTRSSVSPIITPSSSHAGCKAGDRRNCRRI